MVQTDGGAEALVDGQEVWEEWCGQSVVDTDWMRRMKEQWVTIEKVMRI